MASKKRSWKNKGGSTTTKWLVTNFVRGKRHRKQFGTKADAEKYDQEIRTKARAGTFLADGTKITVAEFVPDYISYLEKRHTRGESMTTATLKGAVSRLNNYVLGGEPVRRWAKTQTFEYGLGAYKLADITPDVVEDFCVHLNEFGLKAKTAVNVRVNLVGLLDHARRRRYLVINPARGLRIITSRHARPKRIIVPPKQLIQLLMEHAPSLGERLAIKFPAVTGLRAGEQWALRWDHIDFVRGHVRVDTRVDRYKEEDLPKSDAGIREVPIAPDLMPELREWRATTPYSSDSDLVFPNTAGNYQDHSEFRENHFYPICESAIAAYPDNEPKPTKPRWHDLRHFAVSCWIEIGLPPKAIQEFAGHSLLKTTMEIYGHLFPRPEHREVMNTILHDVFGAASRPHDLAAPEMPQPPLSR